MAEKIKEEKILVLPLGNVAADFNWNARTIDKTGEDYLNLKASIETKGQDTPIEVRPIKGKADRYTVLTGFQRYSIISDLQWPTVRAVVIEVDEAEARSRNLRENTQIPPPVPDRAWGVGQLVAARMLNMGPDFKVTDESIGRELGYSTAFVNQLRTVAMKCSADVFKAWRGDKKPLALMQMIAIAKMPKNEQMAEYRKLIAERDNKGETRGRQSWTNSVFKAAGTLGQQLGELEAGGVIKVSEKAIASFDFTAMFDKIPEDAKPEQLRTIGKEMFDRYVRARDGLTDETDEDEDDDLESAAAN